jgi:glycyl-tRNA synthetase
VVRQRVLQADKAQIGRAFKQAAQPLLQYLESLEPPQVEQLQAEWEREKRVRINLCGKEYVLDQPGMLRFREEDRKVTGEEYTPHVIEPSFGIGRIIYAVLEQCFRVRPNDAQRVYLSLPPWMAPVKCSVLPLVDNDKLNQLVPRIVQLLTEQGISSKVDDTGTAIGRRYARTDEIGIPFGITIDFDTLNDDTVTLRERDSMEQVRVPINEVAPLLFQLVDNRTSWAQVREKYPIYTSAAQDKDE